VFGLGFSGIIPAYVLAVRELFPASEASWRVPTLLLFSGSGMAFGGWLAGAIYETDGDADLTVVDDLHRQYPPPVVIT
jgi:hypothetical protein